MPYRKALVTGGAGFIGSHIVERLVHAGIDTVVLDDLSVGLRENVPDGAQLIVGNLCDPEVVRAALVEVDIVFHQGARVSIRDSFRGFVDDVHSNVIGTATLLKCLEGSQVRKFLYASSMATYGNARYLPIDENHPLEPTSPYGIGKLASERYILCYCKHLGIDPIILRYFNTYGSRQTHSPYVGVITIFVRKLWRGESLQVFGDGMQVRDFISVHDVTTANLLAMHYAGPSTIFNIGTGIGTTVNSLARILKEMMHRSGEIIHLPPQPGEPANSVADTCLAKTELGFTPRWSLEEKLPEVIEWNTRGFPQ